MAKEKDVAATLKRINEKYGDDPVKLAEAYAELEAKLASQGDEVGTLRKQTDESKAALQQYEAYIQQLNPVVQWYNNPDTQKQLQAYNAWIVQQQQASQQAHAQQQYGNGQSGAVGILQPDEVQQLAAVLGPRWQQEYLQPALEQNNRQWQQRAQEMMNQVMTQADQKIKAFSDVQWKIQERTTPKEVLDQMKQYQEAALKYADPKNHDPMKFASEFLDLQKNHDDLRTELETLKAEREQQSQQEMGLLNGNNSGANSFFSEMEKPSVSRNDRFANAVKETQDAVGAAAFRDEFPSI